MATKLTSLKATAQKAQSALFVLKDKMDGETLSNDVQITASGFKITQTIRVADHTVVSEVKGDKNGFWVAIEEMTAETHDTVARCALQTDRKGEVIISGRSQGSQSAFFSLQSKNIVSSLCESRTN